eukprot:CAMPEP_0185731036 /NCGR_PEP_ID=MMETSP1171-20130828/11698_1 /TAXON_ID=374046 /ORGANISM="Helicotheca tamensis, Strain CCMP826" /LENGTH=178 /DNA_ID=CAMNT_0028400205 /DNA_START=29 /DNA_END=565 /DNA_ORIENTATION=-
MTIIAVMSRTVSGSSTLLTPMAAFAFPNLPSKCCGRTNIFQPSFSFHLNDSCSVRGVGCLKTYSRNSMSLIQNEKPNDNDDASSDKDDSNNKEETTTESPTFLGLEPKSEPPPTFLGLEPKSPNTGGGLYDDGPVDGGLLFTGPLILIASLYTMFEIFFGDYDVDVLPMDSLPPPPGL